MNKQVNTKQMTTMMTAAAAASRCGRNGWKEESPSLSLSLLFSLLVGIGIQWRNGVLGFGVRRSERVNKEETWEVSKGSG